MLQERFVWGTDDPASAMLPMALLTSIVRKEALLPDVHTAALAATQLLPVIQAATERHLAATPGHQYSPHLGKELLVSASPPSCCRHGGSLHACYAYLRSGPSKSSKDSAQDALTDEDMHLLALSCRRCAPTWRPAQRGLCCSGTGQ